MTIRNDLRLTKKSIFRSLGLIFFLEQVWKPFYDGNVFAHQGIVVVWQRLLRALDRLHWPIEEKDKRKKCKTCNLLLRGKRCPKKFLRIWSYTDQAALRKEVTFNYIFIDNRSKLKNSNNYTFFLQHAQAPLHLHNSSNSILYARKVLQNRKDRFNVESLALSSIQSAWSRIESLFITILRRRKSLRPPLSKASFHPSVQPPDRLPILHRLLKKKPTLGRSS